MEMLRWGRGADGWLFCKFRFLHILLIDHVIRISMTDS